MLQFSIPEVDVAPVLYIRGRGGLHEIRNVEGCQVADWTGIGQDAIVGGGISTAFVRDQELTVEALALVRIEPGAQHGAGVSAGDGHVVARGHRGANVRRQVSGEVRESRNDALGAALAVRLCRPCSRFRPGT